MGGRAARVEDMRNA